MLWTQTDEKEFRATAFIADDSNPGWLYPVSLRSYVGYFKEYGIPVDIPMIELEIDGESFADNTSKHNIVNDIYRAVSNDDIFTPSDMLRNPVNQESVKQTLRGLGKKECLPVKSMN